MVGDERQGQGGSAIAPQRLRAPRLEALPAVAAVERGLRRGRPFDSLQPTCDECQGARGNCAPSRAQRRRQHRRRRHDFPRWSEDRHDFAAGHLQRARRDREPGGPQVARQVLGARARDRAVCEPAARRPQGLFHRRLSEQQGQDRVDHGRAQLGRQAAHDGPLFVIREPLRLALLESRPHDEDGVLGPARQVGGPGRHAPRAGQDPRQAPRQAVHGAAAQGGHVFQGRDRAR
mmetsp:Transcript_7610/g.26572  ORF Transcript_7610/g.26572 Transcript_7610/m.26572 type:complete len:233 (+) Transcript_7610:958-1656(+)